MSNDLSAADIAAITNGNNGNDFGFGGNGAWWLILFLFAIWGNNGNWGGSGGGGNMAWPWALSQNTDGLIQSGFNQATISASLGDLSNAITNGFAGAEISRANQMMNLTNQLNSAAMAQQQCCCTTQQNIAALSADLAREACADRAAVSDGVRDILANQNMNTQRLLDQMCNDKIDAKNEKIAELQTQLNLAVLRESQNAQTAQILANNEAQTTALEQYLAPVPRPAYLVNSAPVFGNYYTNGCGCGATV